MNLNDVYTEIDSRTTRGNANFYRPLNKKMSDLVRADYAERTLIPLVGNSKQMFFTKSGTLIATGYEQIIIGDYGAYIEFTPDQMNHSAIRDKFHNRGEAKPYQKYWWMESCDRDNIKIYEQIREVTYADYKAGMFYVSPKDLFNDNKCLYNDN